MELRVGVGRSQPPAAPPLGEQTDNDGGACAHGYPGHDQENVN
jgi:hypothetical protein